MEFDDFRKQVKDALEHLYDAAHLETHPLLTYFSDSSPATRTTRAQKLRALLKDSIEQLRPHEDLPSGSPEWRSYLALRQRYVQGLSLGEIEIELGISLRQLQRELHKGLDALATQLWEHTQAMSATASPVQELENELSQWTLVRQNCDLRILIDETLATLQPILDANQTECVVDVSTPLPNILVDATLTRQALLQVLRLAIHASPNRIGLHAIAQTKSVAVMIDYRGQAIDLADENWRKATLLCHQQGGALEQNGVGQIVLTLPNATQLRILVIDDNAAIQQLFERYLAPQQYDVIHVQDSQDAVRLAVEKQPDAITLDVMMPHVDGWQVLKALGKNPATAQIPIIVCSVLKEPELALALGAHAYLKKPVERLVLVETLARILKAPAEAPPPKSAQG